jgi:hypothetical protein
MAISIAGVVLSKPFHQSPVITSMPLGKHNNNPTYSTPAMLPKDLKNIIGVNRVGYNWSLFPGGIGPFPPAALHQVSPKTF